MSYRGGFRPNRSTAAVAWTHKWLAAKTLQEKINITITGIDMSAAFDTIDRATLLNKTYSKPSSKKTS